MQIQESDLHPHFRARMAQRGITREEVERTINDGWNASDAMPGTVGQVFVFAFKAEWEDKFYAEKEVTVYYKMVEGHLVLLTTKARYGKEFPREGGTHENRV